MRPSEYIKFDAIGLADLVHREEVTPQELTEAAVERIRSSRLFFYILGLTFHGIEPDVKYEMRQLLYPELLAAALLKKCSRKLKQVQ